MYCLQVFMNFDKGEHVLYSRSVVQDIRSFPYEFPRLCFHFLPADQDIAIIVLSLDHFGINAKRLTVNFGNKKVLELSIGTIRVANSFG